MAREAVVVESARSALTKAHRGSFNITEPVDYAAFCASTAGQAAPAVEVPEIGPRELRALLDAAEELLLLDVREPFEADLARIDAARLIPLRSLEAAIAELEDWKMRQVVVHCASGVRSRQACELLLSKGFEKYVTILTYLRGEYFDIVKRISDGEIHHLTRSVGATGKRMELRKKQNEFLDAYMDWKNRGTNESKGRVISIAEELRSLDPAFTYKPA